MFPNMNGLWAQNPAGGCILSRLSKNASTAEMTRFSWFIWLPGLYHERMFGRTLYNKIYLGIFDPWRQIMLLYKEVEVPLFNFGSLTDNNLLQDIEAIGWVPGYKIMFCCKFKVRKSLLQIVRMKTERSWFEQKNSLLRHRRKNFISSTLKEIKTWTRFDATFTSL